MNMHASLPDPTNDLLLPDTAGRGLTRDRPVEAAKRPARVVYVGVARPSAARRLSRRQAARRVGQIAVLASADALGLFLSWGLGFAAWAGPVLGQPLGSYFHLMPLLLVYLLGYAKAGLYPGFGLGAVETLKRLTLRTGFVAVILAAASFALKLPLHYSRLTLAAGVLASFLLVPLARFSTLAAAKRLPWWGEPALLVGSGKIARRTARSVGGALSLGYRIVAAVMPRDDRPHSIEGVPVVGGLEAVPAAAARGVRTALLADWDDPHRAAATLEYLQEHFRHVIAVRDFDSVRVEGVAVRNLGGVLGLEYTNQLLLGGNRFLKRALDLCLAVLGLVVGAPLIAFAGVLVKLASPGPVFYSQEREGLLGRKVRVWKLRTMHADAEARLDEHLRSDPEAHREWNRRFKLRRDPRVIPVLGNLLRRLSIDELPQLWNVARGEMSLVGPRPFPDYHLRKFSPEFRALRRRVRPGLSGLWQVMVRSDGGTEEQESFDTYYIRNWSVWMDLYVLARTAHAVLFGRGAY